MRNIARLAYFCGATLWASQAVAQGGEPELGSEGFALDRFDPADRGSEWFALDSVNEAGHVRPAFGLVLDYARKPLVLVNADDEEIKGIVDNQLYAHLGGSVVLFDRLRLGLNIPLLVVNTGDSGFLGGTTFTNDTGAAFGDIRVSGDYRLLGNLGDKARLSAGLRVHIPTGSTEAFAGDGSFRLTPQVMFAGDYDRVTYGARAGLGFRFRDGNFAGETFNTELQIGAAAGYRLLPNRALLIGPELLAAPALGSDGDGSSGNTNPVELLLGAHYSVDDHWRVGLGAGPGLASGFGSPSFRIVASVEWSEPGPKDGDSDGIYDERDACPTIPGEANSDPRFHGCPVADQDSDGIFDAEDACLTVPGIRTADPATNGCPLDTDGDKITDMSDACPRDPGVASPDPSRNGCPMAQIDQGQILIAEQVQFETGSAQIRTESNTVLQAVLAVLARHPEITLISVEGHTDNRGTRELNTGLSRDRAASVVQWLVYHGVSRDRLTSTGYGPDKPIADNNTEAGRQKNRRVEFHINPLNPPANATPVVGPPPVPGPVPTAPAAPAATPTPAPAPANGSVSTGASVGLNFQPTAPAKPTPAAPPKPTAPAASAAPAASTSQSLSFGTKPAAPAPVAAKPVAPASKPAAAPAAPKPATTTAGPAPVPTAAPATTKP
jgi:OmpA-OmpF porin, OOP family